MFFRVSILLLAYASNASKFSQKLRNEGQSPKRLYFDRTSAGLNNVRLQFEVMVATAAAYGRILMIPTPTYISHLVVPFRETDLWSEKELGKAIRFEYMTDNRSGLEASGSGGNNPPWCPHGAYSLKGKGLETVQLHDLPADKDWCFTQSEVFVRHFECLHMFSPDQQKLAAKAVFNGIQIKQKWIQKARDALGSLGLKAGHFVAAHLRRGDFMHGEDHSMETTIPTLNRYGQGQDMLILTDETNPKFVEQLKGGVKAATSLRSSGSVTGQLQGKLEGAVVDMLLGASAGTFIGSDHSTFSLGIYNIRRKMELCKRSPRARQAEALMSQDARVRATRWFDNSHVLTDPQTVFGFSSVCGFKWGDWRKFTNYTDFDYRTEEAVCELDDVQ